MGELPATVAWTVLWPGLLPWLLAAIIPLLLAAWPLRDPARVRWAATDLVAAAARRAGFDRRGMPWLLLALRVGALTAIALAAARPFLAPPAPAVGIPLVAGSTDRRIEIVTASDPATAVGTADDASLALRQAVAALAATPSVIVKPGVPAVDVMGLHAAGAPFPGRRLIVLCDGAVPDAADGRRLAAAVRGGAAVLVCIGPASTGSAMRPQLSAWLRDLAGLEVEGSLPLDDAAIDAGAVSAAAAPGVLAGPSVSTIAAVSYAAPQWTVRARTVGGGRPLVLEAEVGAGRVCVTTIPLTIVSRTAGDAAWSDLAAWPAFLPFIDGLLSSLLDPPAAPTPAATTVKRLMGMPLARLLVAAAIGAVIAEWLVTARLRRQPRPGWLSRLTLILLGIGMFIAWGGRPREQPADPGAPRPVALLIDSSPSMETRDVVTAAGPRSRLAAIQDALAAREGRLLQSLGQGRELQTTTIDTRLDAAIERLATDTTPPATIIVASDGALSAGASWAEVARLLEQRRIPLVAVPVGEPHAAADERVPWGFRFTAIDPPAICRPDERIVVAVRAAASTPHDGALPLHATAGGGELTPADDGDQGPFAYHFTGRCRDELRLDAPRDAAVMETRTIRVANDERHTATYSVVVTRQPIRVLLVDSLPRFEFRFLERLLVANDRFTVSSCLLAGDTVDDLRPTAALPATTDEWLNYDVVVIGDVPVAAATGELAVAWTALREAAERDGIGLAWTPGRRWARDDAGLTSWLAATPSAAPGPDDSPRRLTVTAAGRRLGSFAWLDDRPPDAPPFTMDVFAVLGGVSLAPTARVVATAVAAADGSRLPAVITSRVGAATLVGHLCETWRWRAADGGDAHAWYWTHLLTELAEPRRLARLAPAVLAVRPCGPVAGESLWIDVIPTRRAANPAEWRLDVTTAGGSPRQIAVPATIDGAAATIPLPGLTAGRHTLALVPNRRSPADEQPLTITRDVIVNEPAIETPGGPAGTGPLAAVARATGGEVVALDRLDTLPAAVARAESRMRAAVAAAGPRWFESQVFAHLLVAAAVASGIAAWWPRGREAA